MDIQDERNVYLGLLYKIQRVAESVLADMKKNEMEAMVENEGGTDPLRLNSNTYNGNNPLIYVDPIGYMEAYFA